jgi:hypothetical protein
MNTNIKRLWVEDLRQNPDLQGTGKLKRGDKFCCLGRLCEVYRKETGKGEWDDDGIFILQTNDVESYDCVTLPPNVVEWAGLNCVSPSIEGNQLADLNDAGILTFPDIADLIDKHL